MSSPPTDALSSGDQAARLEAVLAHPDFDAALRHTPAGAVAPRERSLLPAAAITFLAIGAAIQVASQRELWSGSCFAVGLICAALSWAKRGKDSPSPLQRQAAILLPAERDGPGCLRSLVLADGRRLALQESPACEGAAPAGAAGMAYIQGDRLVEFHALDCSGQDRP